MLFSKFKEQQQHHKTARESAERRKFMAQLEASDKLAQYMQTGSMPAQAPPRAQTPVKAKSAARLDLTFVGPQHQHALPVAAPKPAAKPPEPAVTRTIAPFARAVHNVEQEVEQVITELKETVEEKLPATQALTDRASLLLPTRAVPVRVAVPSRDSSDVYFRPILAR